MYRNWTCLAPIHSPFDLIGQPNHSEGGLQSYVYINDVDARWSVSMNYYNHTCTHVWKTNLKSKFKTSFEHSPSDFYSCAYTIIYLANCSSVHFSKESSRNVENIHVWCLDDLYNSTGQGDSQWLNTSVDTMLQVHWFHKQIGFRREEIISTKDEWNIEVTTTHAIIHLNEYLWHTTIAWLSTCFCAISMRADRVLCLRPTYRLFLVSRDADRMDRIRNTWHKFMVVGIAMVSNGYFKPGNCTQADDKANCLWTIASAAEERCLGI